MEKSDAIRRAMRQTAQYELPSGFTPRLMKRVRERERRRETLETLAYLSGGVALIAGCIYAWMQYMESTPREQMSPEMPSLPELRIPDISAAFEEQNQIWLLMAAGFVMLSVCDILLRRRLRDSNTGK